MGENKGNRKYKLFEKTYLIYVHIQMFRPCVRYARIQRCIRASRTTLLVVIACLKEEVNIRKARVLRKLLPNSASMHRLYASIHRISEVNMT